MTFLAQLTCPDQHYTLAWRAFLLACLGSIGTQETSSAAVQQQPKSGSGEPGKRSKVLYFLQSKSKVDTVGQVMDYSKLRSTEIKGSRKTI